MSGNGGGAVSSFRSWLRVRPIAVQRAHGRAANYLGATGAVSVVATNGANFYVTGVKLEIGSVATPFNRQSLAKSMADCQRYYQDSGMAAFGIYCGAASNYLASDYASSDDASDSDNSVHCYRLMLTRDRSSANACTGST